MTEFFCVDSDRYRDVKWAHILGDMRRYHPISGDIGRYWGNIGQYRTILGQFLVVSRPLCVESGPIQVVPGQLIFKPNMVRPCRIRTVTISLKITDIGRYRCIAIYIAHICYRVPSCFNLGIVEENSFIIGNSTLSI